MATIQAMVNFTFKLIKELNDSNSVRVHLSDLNVELWNEHSKTIINRLDNHFIDWQHTWRVDEEDYLTIVATEVEEDEDDEDEYEVDDED